MPDHVVAKGETLGGIAARYGTTWQELAAANDMRNANLIRIGQRLRVPDRSPRVSPASGPAANGAGATRRAAPPPPPPRPAPGREDSTNLFLGKLMEFGNAQAKADFEAGKRVVVALRTPTNYRDNPNGQYDDKIAVLRKQSDGTVQVRTFDGSTEPAGAYAHGQKRAAKGSHTDMNKDGKMDLGRLVLGNYRYRKREGNFMNAVAFRATRTQVAERDTNQDGSFDANDNNRIDRSGAQRSILIHRGGSERFTGSAACQTIKPSQYQSFLAAISITSQPEFSYVLARR
jgi:murein DD-endopeptidase MepM/ murein hydrolase activator NlpD